MKKGLAKVVVVSLVILTMLSVSSMCYAQDALRKLGRGLANILTGWIEIPKNIYDTSVEDNIGMGLTVGLAKGIGMTVVRTGAGIYETITFPFPLPEDYEPLLEPEYVLSEY